MNFNLETDNDFENSAETNNDENIEILDDASNSFQDADKELINSMIKKEKN